MLKRNARLISVTAMWLVTAMIGLFYTSSATVKPFDPNGTVYNAANKPSFDNDIKELFEGMLGKEVSNAVIHITRENDCLCQLTASRHINTIKETVVSLGKTNISLYLSDIKGLDAILQKTPAIAVFDSNGKLSYFGPYSTGIGCLSGNGTVEPYLNSETSLGAIVPMESLGCYC
jgi:hypothetical protein